LAPFLGPTQQKKKVTFFKKKKKKFDKIANISTLNTNFFENSSDLSKLDHASGLVKI
jgi:hypothetical protein